MATQQYDRSFNPIWNFRDLTGLPLDDTYYAFFLENTIPYLPQPVYHDASGNIVWESPIQLTAAGTLPVDVFFNCDLVYRIEIRAGNTQADALIWLIEDYNPVCGGGDGPITSASLTSDNQITNPQFSLISFEPSIVITSAGTTNVAPGWDLVLTGTGSATVTREAFNNDDTSPTNAPYALRLTLTGWTTAYLRQIFDQNGMLWAQKFVSTSVTARVVDVNANISVTMLDSNGTLLGTLLPDTTQIDSNFNEYTGVREFGVTTNPDVPPDAYIEYRINFLSAMDILLSSIQVVSSSVELAYTYEQDTIERQVDHTFHYYRDSILFQPKESLLTGWDFGLNPWQFSDVAVSNVATNEYRGDQTIVIQQEYVANANGNNVSVAQGSVALNYGYTVQAVTSLNQFAIVQYIAPQTCRPYWGSKLSCLVKLNARKQSAVSNIRVKALMLYRSSLPIATSQTVPVASWTVGEGPTTFSAGWSAAVRPKNDPTYNLSDGDNTITFDEFDFSSIPSDNADMTMALVLYTIDSMVESGTPDNITFQSVSLVPNDFAIDSNVLTFDQTLARCQFYYETSFLSGALAGTASILGQRTAQMVGGLGSVGVSSVFANTFGSEWNTIKRATPTIQLYSGQTANAGNVRAWGIASSTAVDAETAIATYWETPVVSTKSFYLQCKSHSALLTTVPNSTSIPASAWIYYQFTADSRLGI